MGGAKSVPLEAASCARRHEAPGGAGLPAGSARPHWVPRSPEAAMVTRGGSSLAAVLLLHILRATVRVVAGGAPRSRGAAMWQREAEQRRHPAAQGCSAKVPSDMNVPRPRGAVMQEHRAARGTALPMGCRWAARGGAVIAGLPKVKQASATQWVASVTRGSRKEAQGGTKDRASRTAVGDMGSTSRATRGGQAAHGSSRRPAARGCWGQRKAARGAKATRGRHGRARRLRCSSATQGA